MPTSVMNAYRCERCSHEWPPRNKARAPKVCPKCKSPYWDRPRRRLTMTDLGAPEVDIAERDGWICQLCGEPVDPSLRHPDPMSKSEDHVVPKSMGGSFHPTNMQLAHLRCNIRKGNRVGVDGDTQAKVLEAIRDAGWTDVQGMALIRYATTSERHPDGRSNNLGHLTSDELPRLRKTYLGLRSGSLSFAVNGAGDTLVVSVVGR